MRYGSKLYLVREKMPVGRCMGKEGAFPQEIAPSRPLRRQREAFYQKRRANGREKGKTAGTKKRRPPTADTVPEKTLSVFYPFPRSFHN